MIIIVPSANTNPTSTTMGDYFPAINDTVTPTTDNPYFGAPLGRRAIVKKDYYYNGEGWFLLVDANTGESFRSPCVFWAKA